MDKPNNLLLSPREIEMLDQIRQSLHSPDTTTAEVLHALLHLGFAHYLIELEPLGSDAPAALQQVIENFRKAGIA